MKNLSVRVLFFWRKVAGAMVMLIFNWPHFSVSPNCCHEMRLPLLIKIYLMNKRNISKHGMNWDTGIAALKNKISHAQDKEVFNAVAHISYCTQWRKGLAIHCLKLCPLLSYCWSAERLGCDWSAVLADVKAVRWLASAHFPVFGGQCPWRTAAARKNWVLPTPPHLPFLSPSDTSYAASLLMGRGMD